MPEQELPKPFVESLRQKIFEIAEQPPSTSLKIVNLLLNFFNMGSLKSYNPALIDEELKKLKNADYRHEQCPHKQFVRELNFSGKTVVIKKVHCLETAKKEIEAIEKIVDTHNQRFKHEKDYFLCKPIAYDLGFKFVLMSKSSKPTLEEIFGTVLEINGVKKNYFKTAKGKFFFDKLKREHSVSKAKLKNAFFKLHERTKIRMTNLLLLGYEKEKFVFMTLIDLG